MCEIAGYFQTAALGLESLARRTGLAHRTVQKIRQRLEDEGVIQLVEQSVGGRFAASERHGAPGRANVYAVGPAAWDLPLKLMARTYAKSRRVGERIPTQNRVGSTRKEPTQNCVATHGLSGEVRVFKTRLGEVGGEGGGRRKTTPPSPTPNPGCRYCYAIGTHHDWCQALNAGWVTNPPKES